MSRNKAFLPGIIPANEPKEKNQMDTVENETKGAPKSLGEAGEGLAELEKQASRRGIKLPSEGPPKTLDKARRRIFDIERQLALGGATASVVPITKPASTGPASSGAENLFAKAGAIARKYKQHANRQSSGRTAAPVPSQAPEDMSRSQLTQAVENEKNHSRRAELFHELQAREKGQPSRQTIQRASKLSDAELEQAIEREKDLDRRTELFNCLIHREQQRRKN